RAGADNASWHTAAKQRCLQAVLPLQHPPMQPAGKVETPPLPRETLLRLYREMVRLRTLDERMMTLQRQGRVGFYGACTGQEAATLARAIALEPSDWI